MRLVASVIGEIGEKPELRHTESGKKVTTVALGEIRYLPYEKDEAKNYVTVWHKFECWGSLAHHACDLLDKGALVQFLFRIDYKLFTVVGDTKSYTKKFPVLVGRSFDILAWPDAIHPLPDEQENPEDREGPDEPEEA